MAAHDDPDEVTHRQAARRHRDWWEMTQAERLRALSYGAGYEDGYADGHAAALTNLFRILPDPIIAILADGRSTP